MNENFEEEKTDPSDFAPEEKKPLSKKRFWLVVGAFLVFLFALGGYTALQILSKWG